MRPPRRGEIWTITGRQSRTVLVISSTVYNEIAAEPTIVTIPVVSQATDEGFCVNVSKGRWAVVGLISYELKQLLAECHGRVGTQTLTDVNNMLFKILATPER